MDKSSWKTKYQVFLTSFIAYKMNSLNRLSKLKDENKDDKSDKVFLNKYWQILINNKASQ